MKERYTREIVNSFPYPIATLFRRLGTKECKDPGAQRLKNILAISETIARLCGIVVLCECREYIERSGAKPPKSLANDFSKMFKRPSWGSWMHVAREGLKWLQAEGEPLCCTELVDFYLDQKGKESESVQALGKLLTLRNQLSHDKLKAMYAHEFKAVCEQSYALLEQVLEPMDFLLDYTVTFIDHIGVKKLRNCEPDFIHSMMTIMGSDSEFMADDKSRSSFMETGSIILRNSESGSYLNLDPLLVYEEEAGKAPDVFFYNGMKKPQSAQYSACKQGGSFDSGNSENADAIARELNALLTHFSLSTEVNDVTG